MVFLGKEYACIELLEKLHMAEDRGDVYYSLSRRIFNTGVIL